MKRSALIVEFATLKRSFHSLEGASAPVLFVRLLVLVLQALMADGAVAPVDARMRVQDVEWSDDERAIMARAEKLRWYSRRVEAENLMAVHVALPSIITTRNVHQASKLDISRWYAAQTGKQWDGRTESFGEARDLATRRRLHPGQPKPFERAEDTLRMYRSAHLLVEPFARGQASVELQDYTRYVGWPSLHSSAGGWSMTCRMAGHAVTARRCYLSRRVSSLLAQPKDAEKIAACKGVLSHLDGL